MNEWTAFYLILSPYQTPMLELISPYLCLPYTTLIEKIQFSIIKYALALLGPSKVAHDEDRGSR